MLDVIFSNMEKSNDLYLKLLQKSTAGGVHLFV